MPINHKNIFSALVYFILFAMLAGLATFTVRGDTSSPPSYFEPLAQIDLSAGPVEEEVVGKFIVDETAVTGVYYSLQGLDSDYFDLRLIGPNGEEITILHREEMRTDQKGGGMWERSLSPGVYRLLLTAQEGPGHVALYWGKQ